MGRRRGRPSTATAARIAASGGGRGRSARCRTRPWSGRSGSCWTDSPFHGEGHRKLWARLRFAGIRTSRRRVLRLTREHGLLAHQRRRASHGPKAHDGTITTERVDLMWGTDLTSVVTGEGQAAVFVAVDHCSAECVGVHASRRADRFEALEPVRQAVRERFGAFAKDVAAGLRLRHDHGSQYVSHHFQAEIRFLGIESSPAFVREPEGNGCAERFIRTLKENLLWVRRFETVEELRLALHRLQANLQPELDHRAARLQDARSGPRRSARPVTHGRVSADRCLTTVDRYRATPSGSGRELLALARSRASRQKAPRRTLPHAEPRPWTSDSSGSTSPARCAGRPGSACRRASATTSRSPSPTRTGGSAATGSSINP